MSTNDPIVSMCNSARATKTSDRKLSGVLNDIRDGVYRDQIAAIRRAGSKAERDRLKLKLIGVLFSGRFSKRGTNYLLNHSGVLVVDLDGLDGDLKRVRQAIDADPLTYASFKSPSGTGLKVVHQIPADPATHLAAFKQLAAHYRAHHNVKVDAHCSDVARLCFVSHDPDLFLNPDCQCVECDTDHTDHIDHTDHTGPFKTIHAIYESAPPPASDPDQQAHPAEKTIWSVSHPEKVDAVIKSTQPRQPGERHRCVFNLARGLKHDAGCADAPMSELKKIVRRWYDQAVDHVGTKGFAESWADFVHAWGRARTGLTDNPLSMAWRRVECEPLPAVCNQYDGERVRRLLALCHYLKRDDGSFYLSMPQAGGLLGIHGQQVKRYLRMFIADGILSVVKLGNRQAATTYQLSEESAQ